MRIELSFCALTLLLAMPAVAQTYVYPAKGQSAEQQKKDEAECYTWAVGQTGFDPAKPPPAATATAAPPPPPPKPSGARIKGAAAGATVAAITDHDTGDAAVAGAVAGGVAQRGAKRQAGQQQAAAQQQAAQQQATQQQNQTASFNKARSACLEGRGYTIK